jgi:hypothetical protein
MSIASQAALCAIVAGETSVLLSIVTAVRHIKEQYDSDEQLADAISGTSSAHTSEPVRVPAFTARMFDRADAFTERHLKGSRAVVLCIEASRTLRAAAQFCATLAGLRAHSDRYVFVACAGSDEECREVQQRIRECGAVAEEFPLVAGRTEDGVSLANVFQLERTPAAIIVDAAGMIVKVGYQAEMDAADERS